MNGRCSAQRGGAQHIGRHRYNNHIVGFPHCLTPNEIFNPRGPGTLQEIVLSTVVRLELDYRRVTLPDTFIRLLEETRQETSGRRFRVLTISEYAEKRWC